MEIRKLTPDEWTLYRDIRLESLRVEPLAFSASYEDKLQKTEAAWREKITSTEKPLMFRLFAIEGGKAIGMCGTYQREDEVALGIATISAVYVTPEYRGRGVAKQMLTALLKEIRKHREIKKIVLSVKYSQTAAHALYNSLGFTQYGEVPEKSVYLMELVL